MLKIIGDRSINDLSEEELSKVQAIMKTIDSDALNRFPPLEKIDLETFTCEAYERLRGKGYSIQAIRKALEMNGFVLDKWRDQAFLEKGEKEVFI